MSARIDADWGPGEFTPVGVLKVSQAALELGRGVVAAGRNALPGKDRVASFHSYLSQRYRDPGRTGWKRGRGSLPVRASVRRFRPPDRIEVADGLEFAIAIPKDICEAATERLIDVAEDGSMKLVLR